MWSRLKSLKEQMWNWVLEIFQSEEGYKAFLPSTGQPPKIPPKAVDDSSWRVCKVQSTADQKRTQILISHLPKIDDPQYFWDNIVCTDKAKEFFSMKCIPQQSYMLAVVWWSRATLMLKNLDDFPWLMVPQILLFNQKP